MRERIAKRWHSMKDGLTVIFVIATFITCACILGYTVITNDTVNKDLSDEYEIASNYLGVDQDKMIITISKRQARENIYKVETDDATYKMRISVKDEKVTNSIMVGEDN